MHCTALTRLASRTLVRFLLGATAVWAMPETARGQIFVPNFSRDTIGEYTTSGATVSASLVSPLNTPIVGIAVSGSDLFVTAETLGTVGEYTTSGATVNA